MSKRKASGRRGNEGFAGGFVFFWLFFLLGLIAVPNFFTTAHFSPRNDCRVIKRIFRNLITEYNRRFPLTPIVGIHEGNYKEVAEKLKSVKVISLGPGKILNEFLYCPEGKTPYFADVSPGSDKYFPVFCPIHGGETEDGVEIPFTMAMNLNQKEIAANQVKYGDQFRNWHRKFLNLDKNQWNEVVFLLAILGGILFENLLGFLSPKSGSTRLEKG